MNVGGCGVPSGGTNQGEYVSPSGIVSGLGGGVKQIWNMGTMRVGRQPIETLLFRALLVNLVELLWAPSAVERDVAMNFQPKDYYEAALDRMDQADLLYSLTKEHCRGLENRRYAWIVYTAGLAVECMFRAYILKATSQFDGRHDLDKLFIASRLDAHLRKHLSKLGHNAESTVIVKRLDRLKTAVVAAAMMWRNSYRYATEGMLCRDLLNRKVMRARDNKGSKAQVLRKLTRLLLMDARTIITAGIETWT